MPDLSKQQGRRLPEESLEMATPTRFTLVSAFFPETIQKIQSRRAALVMARQVSSALGGAASNASSRSSGASGSGSSAAGARATSTDSPGIEDPRKAGGTFIQWPPSPSGSRVTRKAAPFRVPSTDTIPLDGSAWLTDSGSLRKLHSAPLSLPPGRWSVAWKVIRLTIVPPFQQTTFSSAKEPLRPAQ